MTINSYSIPLAFVACYTDIFGINSRSNKQMWQCIRISVKLWVTKKLFFGSLWLKKTRKFYDRHKNIISPKYDEHADVSGRDREKERKK